MLAYKISGNFNKCRKNGVLLFGCFGNVESRPRKEKENNGACALYSLVEQHKMQSSNKESEKKDKRMDNKNKENQENFKQKFLKRRSTSSINKTQSDETKLTAGGQQ